MLKTTLFLCIIAIIFTSCGKSNPTNSIIPTIATKQTHELSNSNNIEKITFLGESTTYHLKSRGVLPNGKETTQVWAPKSGTLMLDTTICECRIIYPESNEEISLEEALKRKQPKIFFLTFGLNGAANFISQGKSYFQFCYQKLINMIKEVSPNTKIIINSCFPVAKNMDMSRYTISSKTLNSYIDTLNVWAEELAHENKINYLNTSSAIKDENGYLKSNLQAEDGYHLNTDAYQIILKCINEYLENEGN